MPKMLLQARTWPPTTLAVLAYLVWKFVLYGRGLHTLPPTPEQLASEEGARPEM
jgi:hypothetical protein